MRAGDKVNTSDVLSLSLKSGDERVTTKTYGDSADMYSSVIHTEGWVRLFLRERGKIVPGSHREGHNVWTNTGKEYLALHQTIQPSPPSPPAPYPDPSPYRVDLIAYIGVGAGSQIEDPGVLSLQTPLSYSGGTGPGAGTFLAPIQSASFPLTPSRTTVEYHRVFAETEISQTVPSSVTISEMGLFTSGDPTTDRASGPRDTRLISAAMQAPVAYKTFEPIVKRSDLSLEIYWQIRF